MIIIKTADFSEVAVSEPFLKFEDELVEQKIISQFDTDGDGKISEDELMEIVEL